MKMECETWLLRKWSWENNEKSIKNKNNTLLVIDFAVKKFAPSIEINNHDPGEIES